MCGDVARLATPTNTHTVQSSPVQSSPVQSSPVWTPSSPVQSSPVQSGPVRSSPVQSGPVQSSLNANGGVPTYVCGDAACLGLMHTGEYHLSVFVFVCHFSFVLVCLSTWPPRPVEVVCCLTSAKPKLQAPRLHPL